VFSGVGNVPYREYDLPCPQNIYGNTKLLGEKYVEQFCNKYFIIRTSWLYGGSGANFVKWVINRAKAMDTLKVVGDQTGNPTNAEDLVYHILKISLGEEYGIYHCSGKGECSRFELASKIINALKIPCKLISMKSTELNQVAKRPEHSSLDNMMLRCTIGDRMGQWEEALEDFLRRGSNGWF
jgi:dTDP-4-dehydrorhamnose reductase